MSDDLATWLRAQVDDDETLAESDYDIMIPARKVRDAAAEITSLRARVAKLERLIEILVENDPDDMAADAVTVLDVWRKEARAALGGEDE